MADTSTTSAARVNGKPVSEKASEVRELQAELIAQRRLNAELAAQQEWVQRAKDAEITNISEDLRAAQELLAAVRSSFWLRLGKRLDIGPWTESGFHLKKLGRWIRALLNAFQADVLGQWTAFFVVAGDAARQTGAALAVSGLFLLHYMEFACAGLLLIAAGALLALEDLCFICLGKRQLAKETAVSHAAASVVIANWNGRHLLGDFLPSVITALSHNPQNEIIVVDNASTDGSAEFLRERFPQVRVLAMKRNLGFGGGSNAGIKAAKNDVVVLLNNDMQVAPDFLAPLLAPFADPLVFAVSSQIFFSDKTKLREETGLTEVRWEAGFPRPGHRVDRMIENAFPCAYPGGGSSAFDRRKLLELGGFDSLFQPFYYEDTDLGFLAWKRGWKVLYQPASVVNHCHRATIGKKFAADFIQGVVNRNVILYCWKNIHDWRMLGQHLAACLADCWPRTARKSSQTALENIWGAVRVMGTALKSRWRARSKAALRDEAAFNQPLGGYFRDRFIAPFAAPPERLQVLFAAPFPMEPPIHGGGVFMKQAVSQLAARADVHLVSFLDIEQQLLAQEPLRKICKSAHFVVRPILWHRPLWTLTPFPVLQFADRDFLWTLHRTMLLEQIDVVQLEYTMLGQYAGNFRHIPCLLFEHDIATQSLQRGLKRGQITAELLLEYLRMRRYEPRMLRRASRVQVCSRMNAEYLLKFAPNLKQVDTDMRAAIDTSQYLPAQMQERDMETILFVGGFSHPPNVEGLRWFISEVFPRVLRERPSVRLEIVGANPPAGPNVWDTHPNIEMSGPVADIRIPFQQATVFICPILTGSGIRVKLLEAFASQIAVVSTTIGAEGLASQSGIVCELADMPETFAVSVLRLLDDVNYRDELALRARELVLQLHDSGKAADKLVSTYKSEVSKVRAPKTIAK